MTIHSGFRILLTWAPHLRWRQLGAGRKRLQVTFSWWRPLPCNVSDGLARFPPLQQDRVLRVKDSTCCLTAFVGSPHESVLLPTQLWAMQLSLQQEDLPQAELAVAQSLLTALSSRR